MQIHIDQSGKVENTRVHTVLAFSNHKSFSILIESKTKRICLDFLRLKYKAPEYHYMRMFCAALFLLLRDEVHQLDTVLIDTEYQGKEGLIKSMLLGYLKKFKIDVSHVHFSFTYIGKRAKAHEIAIETYRGNRPPDLIVSAAALLQILG